MRPTRGRRRLSFAAAVCIFAIGIATGCGGSIPSTDLPGTREVSPALEFPELRDYRGVIGCKMKTSGLDQVGLAELARNAQIDFIFLGDAAEKNSSDFGIGGFTSDVLFIPGASFKVGGGEIRALNLQHPIDESGDLIGQIHDQHAIALAVNLAGFSSPGQYALADAVEIYNIGRVLAAQSPSGLYLRSIFFGADRLFANLDSWPDADLALYDRMTSGARIAMVAGIGAAPNMPVMGTRVGTFEQLFEVYTTHLIASERQIDPIVDALRHGHSYVSFDFLGYVPNFAFFAQAGDRKTMMGDEVPMTAGLKLKVELPAPADKVAILSNGAEVASAQNVSTLEFAPSAAGAYRVEADRAGHPWIYSNPIYVR
jgi:hypothetical protein